MSEDDQSLPNQLRDIADDITAFGDVATPIRQAADEIDRLRRALTHYRWAKLAEGLVICYLQAQLRDKPTRTYRTVIHETDCRHVPDGSANQPVRADSKYWSVHPADAVSLEGAVLGMSGHMLFRRGDVCKTCQPNVDVDSVIDG